MVAHFEIHFSVHATNFKTLSDWQVRQRLGGRYGTYARYGLEINNTKMITLILGFFSLRYRPAPDIVPPVPIPPINISTLPLVSSQISGPVVS